jgi:RNA polymerase sigma-70 factor (ECF subfamily)
MGSPDRRDRATRLMEEYSPALLAYFHRRVDAAEAADLLNDTLLVVWRQARAVPDDDDQARMWMYGIARRVLATHRRSHRRRSALHERLQAELTNVSTEDPDEVRALREALTRLPEIDQEIIRLVHWDGFSQVEVAQLLEMPEATVRSRHQRARQRLRALLGAGSAAIRTTHTSEPG